MASEIRVTNIKANDGTSSLTVANSNGNVTNAGTFTSTGAITASGGIANAGTISAGTFNGTVGASAIVHCRVSLVAASVPHQISLPPYQSSDPSDN